MTSSGGCPPRIVSTATANPDHILGPAETKEQLQRVFGGAYSDLNRARRMVDHTGIESRHLAMSVDELVSDRTLETSNAIYLDTARRLATNVSREAVKRARLSATDIDYVISVSCTGYAIPSLDVYISNDLGIRSDARRLPITELGCGGGAAGLAFAAEFVRSRPGSVVLLVSVELCSVTFQPADMSWENVIASMLFGDGAVAAVVTDRALGPGPAIVADQTHLFPHTTDYMGFTLKGSGLHLVMSPQVPETARREYGPLLADFLHDHDLCQDDLSFYVLHPGGAKILRYLEHYAGVPTHWLSPARVELARHGNMSSASVLFVLDEVMTNHQPAPGDLGVLASLGPGFCAELILLRWDG
ncbi:MAG: type III polyketide synthase [Rhodanobacteraceae bacterium]